MALTIVNEQYPPRKPKLTLTADSLDELPTEGVAEGSTATVGGTEYVYENNSGWVEPGSGGGGSGGGVFLVAFSEGSDESIVADKSLSEVTDALNEGLVGVGTYGTIVLFAVEVPVFKSITTVTPSGLFQRTLVWTQDGSINMVETAYPSESGQS